MTVKEEMKEIKLLILDFYIDTNHKLGQLEQAGNKGKEMVIISVVLSLLSLKHLFLCVRFITSHVL